MNHWPQTTEELIRVQADLEQQTSSPWIPGDRPLTIGGCIVCFTAGSTPSGLRGDVGWAGAVLVRGRRVLATAVSRGPAGAPYEPGLLALREGPLLEQAVQTLPLQPEVLLVNATGRDHPRRAGMALHLGKILDIPTIGVTDRPLLAQGALPAPERGSRQPLLLKGDEVAAWLRTRTGARPVVVHAGWRTDLSTAVQVVLSATFKVRTPEPLRQARRVARSARAQDQADGPEL